MIYLFLIIAIILISFLLLKMNTDKQNTDDDLELFSTQTFEEKENIKSAKCPQCGKIAETYQEVKENFGLRKVGYATDIQSWCRACRKDRDENQEKYKSSDNLDLFNE